MAAAAPVARVRVWGVAPALENQVYLESSGAIFSTEDGRGSLGASSSVDSSITARGEIRSAAFQCAVVEHYPTEERYPPRNPACR